MLLARDNLSHQRNRHDMDPVIGSNRQMRPVVSQVVNLSSHSAHHDVGLHQGVPVQE